MRTVHVVVGQHEIMAGQPKHPFACPIALAIQKTLDGLVVGELRYVGITKSAYPANGGWEFCASSSANLGWTYQQAPAPVAGFAEAFDKGWPVEPIEFDIEII